MIAGHTKIFIRNLRLDMSIGAYEPEKLALQPVLVNLTATIAENQHWRDDELAGTVGYDRIVSMIEDIVLASGHIALLETLGYLIVEQIMNDERIFDISLKLEKPDAIASTETVGVEIFRSRI